MNGLDVYKFIQAPQEKKKKFAIPELQEKYGIILLPQLGSSYSLFFTCHLDRFGFTCIVSDSCNTNAAVGKTWAVYEV